MFKTALNSIAAIAAIAAIIRELTKNIARHLFSSALQDALIAG